MVWWEKIKMIALGVVGPIGAGKDTVAEYIAKKYGFSIVSYRDIVREVTEEKEGLEPNRDNMQKTARMYRDKYGEDVFAKLVLEKALKLGHRVLLKEMRTVTDASVPKNHFKKDLKIICVDSSPEERFNRLHGRKRLGDPKDMDEFMRNENREKEFGFYEAMKMADFRIDNDGTIDGLHRKIDKIMHAII